MSRARRKARSSRWETIPVASRNANTELTMPMMQLIGYLGGKPWGSLPRSTASWRGLAERGLTVVVDGYPPHTELTEQGRAKLAELDGKLASRG